MKTVYLLRHAKASPDSPTFQDRDRPLNDRGHEDAALIAGEMKSRGHVPGLILCSTARRTQDTCAHLLRVMGDGIDTREDPTLYLASDDEILDAVHEAAPGANSVLIIAHNPGLEELAGTLGRDGAPRNFPTGALAVFQFDVDTWQDIERRAGAFVDFLTPKMLKD